MIATMTNLGGGTLNSVSLIGRLTKDALLKEVADSHQVCRFTLAINRSFKNKLGEHEADYIQCTVWNKLAEQVAKYCGKGSLIGVNGRLQTHSYLDAEGKRIYVTDVYVDAVKFLQLKSSTNRMHAIADFQLPAPFEEMK